MKKIISFISICITLSISTACSKTYYGTSELIDKAREEFPIAEKDTAEIQYIGMCGKDRKAIAWFMSGNEYQAHYYLPMEIEIIGNTKYKFIKTHKPIERTDDIVALYWNDSYCFLINNQKCVEIEIVNRDGSIYNMPIEEKGYPYILFWESVPKDYSFLDSQGNHIK